LPDLKDEEFCETPYNRVTGGLFSTSFHALKHILNPYPWKPGRRNNCRPDPASKFQRTELLLSAVLYFSSAAAV
jgi:hypothetical protein